MKNKLILGILVIVLVVFGLVFLYKPSNIASVKIGVILPLSGDLSFVGESAKKSAEMALNSFQNTKNKYQLIFEDDQYNVNKTITAANKLINIDKVGVIISVGSAEGNVVKPLANKNKIIHFNTAASDQTIPDGKYIFTHWTPPFEEVKTMVEELIRQKIKKVGIFTTNNDGMIAITDELKRQLEKEGISVTIDEKINVGERDFRTQIFKMKSNLPDIIVMQNTPPELEILSKQIKEIGIKTPMTSIETFDTTTMPELFKNYWYVTVGDPTDIFKNNYNDQYGSNPSLASGNVYDIISLIIKSTENLKKIPTSEDISSELLKIKDFNGAMGNLSINSNGIVISKATIKVLK